MRQPLGQREMSEHESNVVPQVGWGCGKAAGFVLDRALLQGRHPPLWIPWLPRARSRCLLSVDERMNDSVIPSIDCECEIGSWVEITQLNQD